MRVDRISRATNAGKRWAEHQIRSGVAITGDTAEEAAREKFDHLGMQYLFTSAALERHLEEEAKSASRPKNAA